MWQWVVGNFLLGYKVLSRVKVALLPVIPFGAYASVQYNVIGFHVCLVMIFSRNLSAAVFPLE